MGPQGTSRRGTNSSAPYTVLEDIYRSTSLWLPVGPGPAVGKELSPHTYGMAQGPEVWEVEKAMGNVLHRGATMWELEELTCIGMTYTHLTLVAMDIIIIFTQKRLSSPGRLEAWL